jgi:hypothetical protein
VRTVGTSETKHEGSSALAVLTYLVVIYKNCGPLRGRILLIKVLAHPVNDLVELAGNDGVFGYPTGEGVGGRVEQAPGGALAPVEGGVLPLPKDVGDALDGDDVLAVQVHDGVVGALVR